MQTPFITDSNDFFSYWWFWESRDPTGGHVDFVNRSMAEDAGLVRSSSEGVFIGVDNVTVTNGTGRRSVRILSKATFDRGLFVLAARHVPTGCGAWPAFWLYGGGTLQDCLYGEGPTKKWPAWGEFDIVEGVHEDTELTITLHTNEGCDQSSVVDQTDEYGIKWVQSITKPADNCNVNAEGQWHNQGCSQRGAPNSMGKPLNERGGGVYAAEWDPEAGHMRTWFWPLGTEPEDLAAKAPEPESWGLPSGYFRLGEDNCSPDHFKNMRLAFDVTFCGDYAGPLFGSSCPAWDHMTCEEFVSAHPEEFVEAYWSIVSLDAYQLGTREERQQVLKGLSDNHTRAGDASYDDAPRVDADLNNSNDTAAGISSSVDSGALSADSDHQDVKDATQTVNSTDTTVSDHVQVQNEHDSTTTSATGAGDTTLRFANETIEGLANNTSNSPSEVSNNIISDVSKYFDDNANSTSLAASQTITDTSTSITNPNLDNLPRPPLLGRSIRQANAPRVASGTSTTIETSSNPVHTSSSASAALSTTTSTTHTEWSSSSSKRGRNSATLTTYTSTTTASTRPEPHQNTSLASDVGSKDRQESPAAVPTTVSHTVTRTTTSSASLASVATNGSGTNVSNRSGKDVVLTIMAASTGDVVLNRLTAQLVGSQRPIIAVLLGLMCALCLLRHARRSPRWHFQRLATSARGAHAIDDESPRALLISYHEGH